MKKHKDVSKSSAAKLFLLQDEMLDKHEKALMKSLIAVTSACVDHFIENEGMEDIPEDISSALDSAKADLEKLKDARREFLDIVKAVCSD